MKMELRWTFSALIQQKYCSNITAFVYTVLDPWTSPNVPLRYQAFSEASFLLVCGSFEVHVSEKHAGLRSGDSFGHLTLHFFTLRSLWVDSVVCLRSLSVLCSSNLFVLQHLTKAVQNSTALYTSVFILLLLSAVIKHQWRSSTGSPTSPSQNTAFIMFDRWCDALWIMSPSFSFSMLFSFHHSAVNIFFICPKNQDFLSLFLHLEVNSLCSHAWKCLLIINKVPPTSSRVFCTWLLCFVHS